MELSKYINSLSFKNNNLNFSTKIANSVGDFFLTPVRYMLGGKSGTCFVIIDDSRFIFEHRSIYIGKDFYGNIEEKKSNVIKTALAIALFIPSLIIGTAFKAPALLCSEKLRRRYHTFENLKELKDKAYHELRIGIIFREKTHVNNFLKYVNQMDNSEEFFSELQKGKNIFTGSVFQAIKAKDLSELKEGKMTVQDYFDKF